MKTLGITIFLTLGLIIFIIGLSLGSYALIIDTSVKVDYSRYYNIGLPERIINNLGLISDKQNYLIISGFLILGGIILFAIGANSNEITSENITHEEFSSKETSSALSYCSSCGQAYNSKGKFCENCGQEF